MVAQIGTSFFLKGSVSLVTFVAITYLRLYSQEVFAAGLLREFLLIWIGSLP
jgi:hypothetical protein